MNSPAEIAKNYVGIGEGKAKIKLGTLILLSIMAGMFIAIAGAGATVGSCMVENGSISKVLSGCIFPGGLAMVILAGSELFTGDCLMIISVCEKKIKALDLIRVLVVVWLGNLVGGLAISAAVVYGHTMSLFGNGYAQSAVSIAAAKCNLSFGDALIRGIMCNILVCIAVWMGFAAKDAAGKVVAIFLPILIFVVCGYEHSVANMYYIPAGLMAASEYGLSAEGLTWGRFFINNEIPVTLGNIIGGMFIGVMYWLIYLKPAKDAK